LFGVSKVSRLTREQIVHDQAGTRIMLGAEPLDLPSPLDDLVHQLADTRRGHAVLGHTDTHPGCSLEALQDARSPPPT
jgi:hypothetical protein